MAISLKETYDSLIANGGYDTTQAKFGSLDDLRKLVNNMNTKRTSSGATCSTHVNTSITDNNLNLNRIKNLQFAKLTCSAKSTEGCTCQALAGCECNTRTLTCDSEISYSVTAICASRTTTAVSCECNSRTVSVAAGYSTDYSCPSRTTYYSYDYCSCNSRTSSTTDCGSRTAPAYCYCNSRTDYASNSSCYCASRTSGSCSCNIAVHAVPDSLYSYGNACSCNSVSSSDTVYSTGYSSYASCDCNGRTAYVAAYTYADYSCPSRTTSTLVCDCVTRTTTNPCVCNTRSNALCSARTGCTCNSVCDCNVVNEFS